MCLNGPQSLSWLALTDTDEYLIATRPALRSIFLAFTYSFRHSASCSGTDDLDVCFLGPTSPCVPITRPLLLSSAHAHHTAVWTISPLVSPVDNPPPSSVWTHEGLRKLWLEKEARKLESAKACFVTVPKVSSSAYTYFQASFAATRGLSIKNCCDLASETWYNEAETPEEEKGRWIALLCKVKQMRAEHNEMVETLSLIRGEAVEEPNAKKKRKGKRKGKERAVIPIAYPTPNTTPPPTGALASSNSFDHASMPAVPSTNATHGHFAPQAGPSRSTTSYYPAATTILAPEMPSGHPIAGPSRLLRTNGRAARHRPYDAPRPLHGPTTVLGNTPILPPTAHDASLPTAAVAPSTPCAVPARQLFDITAWSIVPFLTPCLPNEALTPAQQVALMDTEVELALYRLKHALPGGVDMSLEQLAFEVVGDVQAIWNQEREMLVPGLWSAAVLYLGRKGLIVAVPEREYPTVGARQNGKAEGEKESDRRGEEGKGKQRAQEETQSVQVQAAVDGGSAQISGDAPQIVTSEEALRRATHVLVCETAQQVPEVVTTATVQGELAPQEPMQLGAETQGHGTKAVSALRQSFALD